MAADAEKRKRLLLSNSLSTHSNANGGLGSNSDATATRRVKILMLGDSGVGKSSLIMRWTLDTFSPSLVSTVGVNFKSRKVNLSGELMQVQVWDTAGQEQFHKITTSYYKGAQGIMLVYDVTDPASLANVEYWIKNIKSHASDAVQVALIGNKTDLRASITAANSAAAASAESACNDAGANAAVVAAKRICETERGQELAHKYGIPFCETSAKESLNVDTAFLTLVEHIVDSSSGSGAAHSPSTATSIIAGLTSHGGQGGGGGGGGGGLDRRSIVEKADKPKLFGGFKRSSFTLGKNPNSTSALQQQPGASGAAVGGGNGGAGSGGEDGANGDKEKCIIS